jgi:uncharacterized protein YkwD
MDKQGRRRMFAVAAIAAAVAVVLASLAIAARPGGGGGGGDPTGCAHASEPVRQITGGQLRKAVTCLINKQRSRHARPHLQTSQALQRAAQSHTETMVATNCLKHVCPHEPDLEQRLRKAGYLKGARLWEFAENTGCALSAEAMVENWMASTYHRLNILGRKFRDLGVGVSRRGIKDRCKPAYGTFTAVFAFRKPDA